MLTSAVVLNSSTAVVPFELTRQAGCVQALEFCHGEQDDDRSAVLPDYDWHSPRQVETRAAWRTKPATSSGPLCPQQPTWIGHAGSVTMGHQETFPQRKIGIGLPALSTKSFKCDWGRYPGYWSRGSPHPETS
jgi:hypothetical protein